MTNSPLMELYRTWELNVKGLPNQRGMVILGLIGPDDRIYDLRVENSRFVGYDENQKPELVESKLVGARIIVDVKGKQHAILITDWGQTTDVFQKERLETYVLDWADVIGNPLPGFVMAGDEIEGGPGNEPILGPTVNVCPKPKWLDEWGVSGSTEWDETLYLGAMTPYQSVVFEGDRFNPETRTVSPVADDDWFSIGCGTSTLAKLRLTRHTIHTASSWQQVQAALKMYSADYCGDGRAFTLPGEPLMWRDVQPTPGMFFLNTPKGGLEARWDENGALCIGAPRLGHTANPAVTQSMADLIQDIKSHCGVVGHTFAGGYLDCQSSNAYAPDLPTEVITSVNHD